MVFKSSKNMSSAWGPGKSILEVAKNAQVCWVSEGWDDWTRLVPTSHCSLQPGRALCKQRMGKVTRAQCWHPTEIALVPSPLVGRGEEAGSDLSLFLRKHTWEIGSILNSVSPVTWGGSWETHCLILNFVMTFKSFAYKLTHGTFGFLGTWKLSCQCLDRLCLITKSG
jgi:hypothetical protein